MLHHVEKELTHGSEQEKPDLLGFHGDHALRLHSNTQLEPVPCPVGQPPHDAFQVPAVMHRRAELGRQRTGDIEAFAEHGVDPADGFLKRRAALRAPQTLQGKTRPGDELLELVMDHLPDPAPFPLLGPHELGREGLELDGLLFQFPARNVPLRAGPDREDAHRQIPRQSLEKRHLALVERPRALGVYGQRPEGPAFRDEREGDESGSPGAGPPLSRGRARAG